MNIQNHDNHPQENQPSEEVPSSRDEQPLERIPTAEEELSTTSPSPAGFKLTWQFAAGFLSWFLVNGGLWLLLLDGSKFDPNKEGSILTNGICVFPLNLAIMAVLLWEKKTRQIGQGILAAYAVNFAISLVLGVGTNAVCLIPFFN